MISGFYLHVTSFGWLIVCERQQDRDIIETKKTCAMCDWMVLCPPWPIDDTISMYLLFLTIDLKRDFDSFYIHTWLSTQMLCSLFALVFFLIPIVIWHVDLMISFIPSVLGNSKNVDDEKNAKYGSTTEFIGTFWFNWILDLLIELESTLISITRKFAKPQRNLHDFIF